MNRKLIAVLAATTMAGAAGFSAIASAEATVYGRVVAGAILDDTDTQNESAAWNLGATDQDGGNAFGSRLGVRGSIDLGNGSEAGFQIERGIGKDATSQRYNNVYLSGGWGKLTIGQQGNNYNAARNWDQTNYLGGAHEIVGSRTEGIGYSMSSGPFNFSVMATGNDENINAGPSVAGAPAAALHNVIVTPHGAVKIDGDDGIDSWIIQAGYDFGVVALNVAHSANNDDLTIVEHTSTGTRPTDPTQLAAVVATENDARVDGEAVADDAKRSGSAIGVNGSVGSLDWNVAYQTSELNSNAYENDIDSIGGFLAFKVSGRDKLYAYHVQHSADRAGDHGGTFVGEDHSETLFGYSRNIGPGVNFVAEHRTLDNDLPSGTDGDSPTQLVLAVKVDF